MDLGEAIAARYVRHAFEQMLAVAVRLGDGQLAVQPLGPKSNSVAALIVHCCAMAEFWLGHVALGRPSSRDRASEFTATATLAELHTMVERAVTSILDDMARIEAGGSTPGHAARAHLLGGGSDDSVVLHVLEELFQHLGQMEITADALLG